MDIFLALADSLGVNCPHLPLKEGMMTEQVVPLLNALYFDTTPQDVNSFTDCQVYYNREGRLEFQLMDRTTGTLLMTFVNRSMEPVESASNVPLINGKVVVLGPPLVLSKGNNHILDGLEEGYVYPIDRYTHDDFPYTLSTALNSENYLGAWSSGTFGDLCTGGLAVLYKGPGKNTPEGYPKPNSPLAVVIELRHGDRKGLICLAT